MNPIEGLLVIVMFSIDVVAVYKYVVMIVRSKNVPILEKILRHLAYVIAIGSIGYLLWKSVDGINM